MPLGKLRNHRWNMWFGVAPAPSPTRIHAQQSARHPDNCTCSKHGCKTRVAAPDHESTKAGSPRAPSPMRRLVNGVVPRYLQQPQRYVQATSPRMYADQLHASDSSMSARSPHKPRIIKATLQRDAIEAAASPTPSPRQYQAANTAAWRPNGPGKVRHLGSPSKASSPRRAPLGTAPVTSSAINRSIKHRSCHTAQDALDFDNNAGDDSSDHPDVSRLSSSRRNVRRPPTADRLASAPHTFHPEHSGYNEKEARLGVLGRPSKSRRASRGSFTWNPLPRPDTKTEFFGDSENQMLWPSFQPTRSLPPEHLVGHTSSICALFAQDDRFIVSCSIDGSIKIWSRATFVALHTLYGHTDSVSCVDLSHRWLVSGSHDTTLRLYSCTAGFQLVHILSGHTAHVTRVQLVASLPNQVLSCSDDATIRIWDGENGECAIILRSHASRITCLLLTQGARLCSGAADAAVCFWDLSDLNDAKNACELEQERSATRKFRVHTSTVQCIAASGSVDSPLIISSSNDGTLQIFSSKTMEHHGCLASVGSPIYKMIPYAHGRLACSTGDGRLMFFVGLSRSTLSSLSPTELQMSSKWISSLHVHGRVLACTSDDTLYLVDLESLSVLLVLETSHGFLNCADWLHSTAIITGGQDNVIKLWNLIDF